MPALSNMKLHMDLIADLETRGKQHIDIGNDMLRKSQNMLAYAQAHCDHDWIKPLPKYAHEGGVCKHCKVNQLAAADHRKRWLAMEDAGIAPWGPRAGWRGDVKATLSVNTPELTQPE